MLPSIPGTDLAADLGPFGATILEAGRTGIAFYPIISPIASYISSGSYHSVPCRPRETLPKRPYVATSPRNRSGDVTLVLDAGDIIDRGRGPEIAGTRITIYDIMDFLEYGCDTDEIARDLWIQPDLVQAAINYIRSHREQSDREYALIMERLNRPNPPGVEPGRAKTREELQQRITAHLERTGAHDHPGG